MARTRSTKGTASAASKASASKAPSASSTSRFTLTPSTGNPSKLFILPKEATPDARIVLLPNPRYAKPTRYLVCPDTGIYEFTRICTPKTLPRSWLITRTDETPDKVPEEDDREPRRTRLQAEVTKGADLYMATKIDPVFLMLPALAAQPASKSSDSGKRMFLTTEDHLDALSEDGFNIREILLCEKTRRLLESRMACVCDTVDAGDEKMFRLSESKLLELVLSKARRVTLPSSMHEKFVDKALEAPVLGQKSQAAPKPPPTDDADPESATGSQNESNDSQSSVATTDSSTTAVSQASTAATSVTGESAEAGEEEVAAAIQASDKVVKLQELRVAFNFICSSYVPSTLSAALKDLLTVNGSKPFSKFADFTPLDDYLARLAKLRQEATLNRSASDFSRKRALDEEQEERAEKKRKMDEDAKRKRASESRGVKQLKKVNVSGMKKMSDFFKKQ